MILKAYLIGRGTEPGELCLKGLGISPGYWRRLDETIKAFYERGGLEQEISEGR